MERCALEHRMRMVNIILAFNDLDGSYQCEPCLPFKKEGYHPHPMAKVSSSLFNITLTRVTSILSDIMKMTIDSPLSWSRVNMVKNSVPRCESNGALSATGWEWWPSLLNKWPDWFWNHVVPVIQDDGHHHQLKCQQGGRIINDTAIDLVAIHVPMTNPSEA